MDLDSPVNHPWTCNFCTFSNPSSSLSVCEMCRSDRSSSDAFARHGYGHFFCFSLSPSAIFRNLSDRQGSLCNFHHILAGALAGVLTGMFAVVGAFTGALTGALAGRATSSGLIRGAGLGSVAGAVLFIEVLEALRSYWHSSRTRFAQSSSTAAFIHDLLNGRFSGDQFSSPMFNMNAWQVSVAEMSYEEIYDMFAGENIVNGVSETCVKMLPCHTVNKDNRLDSCGESICCAICLQELQEGESARSLPLCHHVYHTECIDMWIFNRGSCPVCRRHLDAKA